MLWRDLGEYLFDELAGVTMPRVPQPPETAPKVDLSRYTGKFERLAQQYEIDVVDGELIMTATMTGPLAERLGAAPQKLRLRPIDSERFHVKMPTGEALVVFSDFDKKGQPGYVFMGRVAPRMVEARTPAKRKTAKTTKATKATKATKTATKTAKRAARG
jgi:hypothetical protein